MSIVDPIRVLVIMPYWAFFEQATTIDLRADRERLLRRVADTISQSGAVITASLLLETVDDVDELLLQLDPREIDVLVVASAMAAPPAPVLKLIRRLSDVSLVIWPCAWPSKDLVHFTHSDIVERGGTVGTPMLTSVLVKEGRAFALLSLSSEVERLGPLQANEIAAAAVATQVRRARIARVGSVLDGYESIFIEDAVLEACLGVSVVRLSETVLASLRQKVSATEVVSRIEQLRRSAVIECDDASLRAAASSVAALDALVATQSLNAGTLNCHCAGIRFSPAIGHAPCLALGESTSRGVPWTCTGDVLTAVAMLISSLTSRTSIYHEIEAFDPPRGEFILANSGEHDTRWSDEPPRIVMNPWWQDSVCAIHPITPGPATLLALGQVPDGLRLIAAEGVVTSGSEPSTGTISARFSWDGANNRSGWARWVEAGAGHHSVLGRGHLAGQLQRISHHLGLDFRIARSDSAT